MAFTGSDLLGQMLYLHWNTGFEHLSFVLRHVQKLTNYKSNNKDEVLKRETKSAHAVKNVIIF